MSGTKEQQKIDKSVNIENLEILGNNLGFFIDGKAAQPVHFGINKDFECEATWQLDELNPQIDITQETYELIF